VFRAERATQGLPAGGQRSGAFKRAVVQQLLPYTLAYSPIAVAAADGGEPVQFGFANIKQLLTAVATECACFREWLFQQSHAAPLRPILCQDETTAGNVLATDARQKIALLYMTFEQQGDLLDSPLGWLPLSAISHEQAARARGGMPAVTAAWLRAFAAQRLGAGFTVRGVAVRIQDRIHAWISDLDAQRQTFDAKGSAGLKPCLHCANIVSKSSPAAADGAAARALPPGGLRFYSIRESDSTKFVPVDAADLENVMADAMARAPHMSKAQRELHERVLGFNIALDSQSNIWGCSISRRLLPLSVAMNDSMHCYFACGIASEEINRLVQAIAAEAQLSP
jgi:hypothetical protein